MIRLLSFCYSISSTFKLSGHQPSYFFHCHNNANIAPTNQRSPSNEPINPPPLGLSNLHGIHATSLWHSLIRLFIFTVKVDTVSHNFPVVNLWLWFLSLSLGAFYQSLSITVAFYHSLFLSQSLSITIFHQTPILAWSMNVENKETVNALEMNTQKRCNLQTKGYEL